MPLQTTQLRLLASTLGCVLTLSVTSPIYAAPAEVVFETRFATAADSQVELAPLPTIGLAPVGLAISSDLGEQLGSAVAAQLKRIPDGAQFEVLERRDTDKVRWVFAARTSARDGYAPLVPAVNDQLYACLRTLPDSSTELASMIALLAGVTLSTREQASAARAAQSMLDQWQASKCSNAHAASVLLDQQQERVLAATRGMLTGQFDATVFRGQNLLQLISNLSVVFFDKNGLWAKNREARLREVFGAALQDAFLPEVNGTLGDWLDTQYDSFWSWVLALGGAQPSLSTAIPDVVASACAPDLEHMREPFQLTQCVDGGSLMLTTIRSGALRVHGVEKAVGP